MRRILECCYQRTRWSSTWEGAHLMWTWNTLGARTHEVQHTTKDTSVQLTRSEIDRKTGNKHRLYNKTGSELTRRIRIGLNGTWHLWLKRQRHRQTGRQTTHVTEKRQFIYLSLSLALNIMIQLFSDQLFPLNSIMFHHRWPQTL